MSKPVRELKSVKQDAVDLLFSVYNYAVSEGYTSATAKRIALVALDRRRQTGDAALDDAIRPIKNHTATGGSQTVKVFNRLTKGKKLERRVNVQRYLGAPDPFFN